MTYLPKPTDQPTHKSMQLTQNNSIQPDGTIIKLLSLSCVLVAGKARSCWWDRRSAAFVSSGGSVHYYWSSGSALWPPNRAFREHQEKVYSVPSQFELDLTTQHQLLATITAPGPANPAPVYNPSSNSRVLFSRDFYYLSTCVYV